MKTTIRLSNGSFQTVEVSIAWQKDFILRDIRTAQGYVNEYKGILQHVETLKLDRNDKRIQEMINITEQRLESAKNELEAHKSRLLQYIAK